MEVSTRKDRVSVVTRAKWALWSRSNLQINLLKNQGSAHKSNAGRRVVCELFVFLLPDLIVLAFYTRWIFVSHILSKPGLPNCKPFCALGEYGTRMFPADTWDTSGACFWICSLRKTPASPYLDTVSAIRTFPAWAKTHNGMCTLCTLQYEHKGSFAWWEKTLLHYLGF